MSDTSWYHTTEKGANSAPSKVRPGDHKDVELWKLDGLEAAAAVGRGEVGAMEVLEAHLGRIAAVNPSVNAVANLLADRAREAAEETDRRRARGEPLGSLAGVPFTVKENIEVAGSVTTQGVQAIGGPYRRGPVLGRSRSHRGASGHPHVDGPSNLTQGGR